MKKENVKKEYVVAIGASAGGLEALQKLLSALPSNTGFSYLIVQHLSPDYKSLLSEILSKYTEMPVFQVEEGTEIKENCVYVNQPGKNMKLVNGKIVLSSQKEKELNLPIDLFFRSIAEEVGSKAIAVILSGTGSDGSSGIKAIKENDGLILVQDLDTAKFDGMPRSAMRTGVVDAQLSPEEIALEIAHVSNSISKQPYEIPEINNQSVTEELMKKVYYILKKVSNVNFTHYKQTTIIRRIERRMMLTRKETLIDYVDYLYDTPEEVKTLSKEVLIGVTSFFRDPEFFQILKEKAIQNIVLSSTQEEPIRVWVAGCSTGEEAYSIAILFCEVLESLKIRRNIKIFATDLDVEAITIAGKGSYGDSIIDSVSPARLSRYFTRQNNTYMVNRDIRKMIVFSPHNVFQDPPFGRLDLISCRNMLIYFQPVLQNDLFAIFHTSLKDEGYLFLGKSEAIGAYTEAYPIVDVAAKIFSHNRAAKIAGAKVVPYLQTTYLDEDFSNDVRDRVYHSLPIEIGMSEEEKINISLLEQFMPACLVINEKNEIVHIYGENSNYVHLSIGKFSNILYDVLTEELKVPVSTLLKLSKDSKQKAQYKDIVFKGEHRNASINLTVLPISKKVNDDDNLMAIIFSENKQRGEMKDAIHYDIDSVASQRITDLEQDLRTVQSKLDRSIAEQECINEELQAANEELLTANEELQSSNEELQSVNEELYTVNSEYQQKLTELAELNDDIANFLSSTLIGIIFVDNKLNIRRYTDYVTTEFSVMDHDIGRSLKFISYHFPTVDISEICDNVLKTLVPDEREIATGKNKVFFMRVAPFRSTENKILGCVITLVDVTTQKQGLVKLQSTEERLSIAQQASEAKNDYFSKLAHEIRTPMASLLTLSKEVISKIDEKDELKADAEKMKATVDYMASIVTDLTEAARVDREGFADQTFESFSLRKVLDHVTSIFEEKISKGKIKFEISMDTDFSPTYIGNKTSLQQIISNFLDNAIKYTPENGAISIKAYEKTPVDNKANLCLVITDTGIGIGKDFVPHLFKPFTQEGKSKNQAGMGLGLSIAYNLIRSMDGNVSVDTVPNEGTTFTINLLLDRYKKIERKNTLKKISEIDLTGKHILVAEDNLLNRTILCSILANEGIIYVEANDGEEAVKLYMESPNCFFDCILMDMRMPKIDGIKATMMIRDSGKEDCLTIPIIGVSANGFSDDIKQAKNAGVDKYTTKPIDRDKLLSIIKEMMNK